MMPEPDLFFISISLRVVITGLFVLSMGWMIAHASTKLAAVAIAMPVVIGPGFLILALERDRDFILRAAEDSLGALAGTVAFAVTVALLAGKAGRSIVLVSALVIWLLVVSLTGHATGVYGNLAAFAAVYLTGLWILRAPAQGARGLVVWSIRAEFLRAAAAGLLVGLVTLGAERLGPTLSGTLIALPVGMLFVASGVLNAADGYHARVVLSAGARGSAALALFLIVVQVLLIFGMMPVATVLLATVASVLAALGLGLMVRSTLVASAGSPDGQPYTKDTPDS